MTVTTSSSGKWHGLVVPKEKRSQRRNIIKMRHERYNPRSGNWQRCTTNSVSKEGPFLCHFEDDRRENLGLLHVCQLGVFNEGHSLPAAIRLSKERNEVFNNACAMPSWHAVANCKVKTSLFLAVF